MCIIWINLIFASSSTELLQHRTLPMGMGVSPSIQQSSLNRLLKKYLFKCCIVYCDDILIFTNSSCKKNHMEKRKKARENLNPFSADGRFCSKNSICGGVFYLLKRHTSGVAC